MIPVIPEYTDLQAFIDLYKRLGIKVIVNECERKEGRLNEGEIYIVLSEYGYGDTEEKITYHKKFGGYTGFYTEIIFDKDGKFINQDFYE